MTLNQIRKPAGAIAAFAAIVLAMTLSNSRIVRGDDDDNDRNESKVRKGFQIAPVPLNLKGKDHELVGLGSYIVNAQGDCNGCHSAGPQTEFLPGGNPFFGQPQKINPATYLGGGRDFGPYPGPNSSVHIISRNLTPDKTGRAEGGETFAEFLHIIRTGEDVDQRALTASRRPHQAGPGAALEGQVGASQRNRLHLRLAVDVVEAPCLDRHVGASCPDWGVRAVVHGR